MTYPRTLPGDVFLVHAEATPISRLIQQAQWRRRRQYREMFPWITEVQIRAACEMNHAAVVGPPVRTGMLFKRDDGLWEDAPPLPSVMSAELPRVKQWDLPSFITEWVDAIPGAYCLLLRMPGLSNGVRGSIGMAAETFEHRPYDVQTLLAHGNASLWWRLWHLYAAWLTRHMRPTEGSVICSELVVRAYMRPDALAEWQAGVRLPTSWLSRPDAVDPAMLALCGAWNVEQDSREDG